MNVVPTSLRSRPRGDSPRSSASKWTIRGCWTPKSPRSLSSGPDSGATPPLKSAAAATGETGERRPCRARARRQLSPPRRELASRFLLRQPSRVPLRARQEPGRGKPRRILLLAAFAETKAAARICNPSTPRTTHRHPHVTRRKLITSPPPPRPRAPPLPTPASFEPRWLAVTRPHVTLPRTPLRNPIRILHLADLHRSPTVAAEPIVSAVALGDAG